MYTIIGKKTIPTNHISIIPTTSILPPALAVGRFRIRHFKDLNQNFPLDHDDYGLLLSLHFELT